MRSRPASASDVRQTGAVRKRFPSLPPLRQTEQNKLVMNASTGRLCISVVALPSFGKIMRVRPHSLQETATEFRSETGRGSFSPDDPSMPSSPFSICSQRARPERESRACGFSLWITGIDGNRARLRAFA